MARLTIKEAVAIAPVFESQHCGATSNRARSHQRKMTGDADASTQRSWRGYTVN